MDDHSTKELFTREELEIALIKSKTSELALTLVRVENRLERIDGTIKSQFNNCFNCILGIYGIILGALFGHLGGVF